MHRQLHSRDRPTRTRIFQLSDFRQRLEEDQRLRHLGRRRDAMALPKVRQRIVFLPESLVLLTLSLGWTALKAIEPLISMLPLSALVSPFVATGYLYIALRVLFRGKKA